MRPLLESDQLQKAIAQFAQTITEKYEGHSLMIVAILDGSLLFMADLIRQLKLPVQIATIHAKSYGQGTIREDLQIGFAHLPELKGKEVLLLDDIYDTGHTLSATHSLIKAKEPASLASVVLLRKHGRQEVEYEPDYHLFDINDEFVVGYGLDYRGDFRNLPYVAIMEPGDVLRQAQLR
ncbi:MAG: hypoxanthine phosphoribosyltransferase [Pirellulaceae bacterium]|nr:hypoxanthine phosphoribosyltransferase [Pirellulaceae bacterium]